MSAVVHIDHLNVAYGRRAAVRDVSLDVLPGAVFALLGRNGAGKSSLLRCLLGLQRPDSGSVELFGLSSWRERAALMHRIGVVPEEPDAPPDMRVDEIVGFCRRLYRQWDEVALWRRLDRFGVPRRGVFGSLSKGQKGQVGLALALAPQPQLLVLDDPTLGLDAVARRLFFDELIADLADRGTTVMMTTHDLNAAEPLVTQVAVMKEGALVLNEESESLKRRFRRLKWSRPVDASALGPMQSVRTQSSAYGVATDISNYDEQTWEAVRSQGDLGPVEVASMSLEDIFVAVTGGMEEGQ